MAQRRLLVPVSDTSTCRQTVEYAVRQAGSGSVHLVAVVSGDTEVPEGKQERDYARTFLNRAEAWAQEDAASTDIDIELGIVGEQEYLFGPDSIAKVLGEYARANELQGVVVDPEYWPDVVGPMRSSFEQTLDEQGLEVYVAPVSRPARHERLGGRGSPTKIASLFGISLVFYLILGDPFYWFDLITGVAVAAVVALLLGNVTFARQPRFPQSIYRNARFAVYIPYLLFEIIKANLVIATVILHPRLPIDPKLTRVNTKVEGGLPLLALANSITLTPGTLTVEGNDQRLVVHTLLADAREDLFDGRLERAVRFVFYGRSHARIASPRERGDTEIIEGDES